MSKYYKWIIFFIIVAALVVLRLNTDIIKLNGDPEGIFDYGFWSLVPALLTLILAFTTRQVLLALFLGIVTGGLVSGNFDIVTVYILPALGTAGYAQILLIYLWCLGGLIGLWSKTGGAQKFAGWAAGHLVRGPKSAKFFAYLMGLVFHQGGTISTVLAGTTVKPVTDAEKVSHEELAYIVDSTAAPVATLIPFNVWPTYTGALIVGTTMFINDMDQAVAFYFSSIPFNFYAIIAIFFTMATSLEFMPWYGKRMKNAIKRSRETGELDAEWAEPMTAKELTHVEVPEGYKPGIIDFLVPMGTLICLAGIPIFLTGKPAVNQAFFVALIAGMLLALVKGMRIKDVLNGFLEGVKGVTIGAIILGLAVTLGKVSASLGTANFIVNNLGAVLPAIILPASFLGICMLISFSTGTSLGTYAVVLPLAMPLAVRVAELANLGNPELFITLCFGAVIGGAVYGDNCSPISDTTILSSVATGCDLMDHVYTQLPMSSLAAGLAAILYTVAVMFTF